MPTYVSLLNWTQKGIEKVKESPNRLEAARGVFREIGVELKDFYMTTGRYDLLCVIDAPDDATLAKAMLALGSKGSVRSETLRAFSETDYRTIIGGVPA